LVAINCGFVDPQDSIISTNRHKQTVLPKLNDPDRIRSTLNFLGKYQVIELRIALFDNFGFLNSLISNGVYLATVWCRRFCLFNLIWTILWSSCI